MSVFWESGKYPEKLARSVRNSAAVVSAWDNDRLVGLGNAVTDNEFLVFIPWLLVQPDYQRRGIGTGIMTRLMEKYQHVPRIALNAYNEQKEFYEPLGFVENTDAVSMVKKQQQ